MVHKVGDRLSKYRKDRSMSQEELATVLNVTRQTISKWETGETLPDMYNAIALTKLFHISLDQLVFGGSDKFGERSYLKELDENRTRTNKWAIIIGSIGSVIFATSIILFRALNLDKQDVAIMFAVLVPIMFVCWVYAILGFIKTSRINQEIKYMQKVELRSIEMGNANIQKL